MHLSFWFLGFLNIATTLLVLLSFTNCLPLDKYSPHCKVSKTAQGLIRHLLPMSLTLGGNVYRSYTKIVSLLIYVPRYMYRL